MKVRALFFGRLRELVGDVEQIDIPAPATVQDVLSVLCAVHPVLSQYLNFTRVALNAEYVSSDTPVQDGDEVALLPPVSGG